MQKCELSYSGAIPSGCSAILLWGSGSSIFDDVQGSRVLDSPPTSRWLDSGVKHGCLSPTNCNVTKSWTQRPCVPTPLLIKRITIRNHKLVEDHILFLTLPSSRQARWQGGLATSHSYIFEDDEPTGARAGPTQQSHIPTNQRIIFSIPNLLQIYSIFGIEINSHQLNYCSSVFDDGWGGSALNSPPTSHRLDGGVKHGCLSPTNPQHEIMDTRAVVIKWMNERSSLHTCQRHCPYNVSMAKI